MGLFVCLVPRAVNEKVAALEKGKNTIEIFITYEKDKGFQHFTIASHVLIISFSHTACFFFLSKCIIDDFYFDGHCVSQLHKLSLVQEICCVVRFLLKVNFRMILLP